MEKTKPTIYLVDSDTSTRRGLTNLLTVAGYEVFTSKSYKEFAQSQRSHSDACLLLDADTSWVSINDLKVKIRQKKADFPAILISSQNNDESRQKALLINASGLFRKPVDGPALIDAIRWAIESYKNEEC